ncbi:GTP cyclohydrolase I FolE [Rhodohalobacter sp. 8-1]|uniref:GTP cyclohydrolase I FolE n=1 Tax=Rhodohalobacter sp. 8-1 TaxID=3131972 RepID=UPI0030ECE0F7
MKKNKQVLDDVTSNNSGENTEDLGDEHIGTAVQTPLREDAFDLTDEEKIKKIESHFSEIMHTLGLDLDDESLSGTPYRVAKMYVKEVFQGLNPKNRPDAKKFGNKYEYRDLVVVKNINVTSFCEHHFLPFLGKAHVAYKSSGRVIGLSKINRMVDYYSRRPQVQERLTLQIADELQGALETEDVAVFIESKHLCVSTRGIKDRESSTVTTEYRGDFREAISQQRFIDYIHSNVEM